jgi:hypothetical protein
MLIERNFPVSLFVEYFQDRNQFVKKTAIGLLSDLLTFRLRRSGNNDGGEQAQQRDTAFWRTIDELVAGLAQGTSRLQDAELAKEVFLELVYSQMLRVEPAKAAPGEQVAPEERFLQQNRLVSSFFFFLFVAVCC